MSAVYISLSVLIASCGKTKSADPPLPTTREEAVFITTDNNTL